jgi:hypothetical protein
LNFMKNGFSALLLVVAMVSGALAAGNGPQVNLIDHKLSINAESISLARLLRLLDLATGMQSKVPPELANRNISVRFSGLSLEDGVRKIFQGQPFDYVVLEGQGVIVTSAQTTPGTESAPAYTPPQQSLAPQPIEQPFVPDFQPPVQPGFQPGQPVQPGQQPAMIQTPFGPIANPRAGQPVPQVAPAPAPALQQSPLFPDQRPNQQPSQGLPGAMPATPTPFGTPSPFGTPQTSPNNANNPFGAPTVFSAPGGIQTRP